MIDNDDLFKTVHTLCISHGVYQANCSSNVFLPSCYQTPWTEICAVDQIPTFFALCSIQTVGLLLSDTQSHPLDNLVTRTVLLGSDCEIVYYSCGMCGILAQTFGGKVRSRGIPLNLPERPPKSQINTGRVKLPGWGTFKADTGQRSSGYWV